MVTGGDESVRQVALDWIDLAKRLGWGIEGPRHAEAVMAVVRALVRHEAPDESSIEQARAIARERDLGSRPIDALIEAADLLLEAHGERGARRAELVSAARGWLALARS